MDEETAGRTAAPPTLTALTTYLLSRTGKTARGALAAELALGGLRLWHMAALAALADFGPQAQRELSARLSVDPSDMVRVIDELAAPGYVERARDPSDRRRVRVTLTPAGREALAGLSARAASVQDAVLAPLDAGERAVLHELLAKVYDAAHGPARRRAPLPRPPAGHPSPAPGRRPASRRGAVPDPESAPAPAPEAGAEPAADPGPVAEPAPADPEPGRGAPEGPSPS